METKRRRVSPKERAMKKTVVLLAVALVAGCVSESTY
jgi:hypothetical protein